MKRIHQNSSCIDLMLVTNEDPLGRHDHMGLYLIIM